MKKNFIVLSILSVLALPLHRAGGQDLKTEKDSMSYAMGIVMGQSFSGMSGKDMAQFFDPAVFVDAFNARISGAEMGMNDGDANRYLQSFAMRLYEKMTARNKEDGERFLAENAAKPGVKVTESGLQYYVRSEGDGAKPVSGDRVEVHYRGSFIDGAVFDSSYERGEPVALTVDHLIRGFSEGLKLMSPGAEYILYIPQELAYGEHPVGGSGKPYSALVFEVELIRILPPDDTVYGEN